LRKLPFKHTECSLTNSNDLELSSCTTSFTPFCQIWIDHHCILVPVKHAFLFYTYPSWRIKNSALWISALNQMKENPRNSQFTVDWRHRGLVWCGQRRASGSRVGDGGGAGCGIRGRLEAPGAGTVWTVGPDGRAMGGGSPG
jgi:hypothetical protein